MEKNKNRNKVYILLYVILKEKKVCNDEKEKEMRNLPTMIKYKYLFVDYIIRSKHSRR